MRLRDLGKLWPYNKLLDAMVNDSQAMASPEMEEWYQQLAAVGMDAIIPDNRIQGLSTFQKLLFIRWVWVPCSPQVSSPGTAGGACALCGGLKMSCVSACKKNCFQQGVIDRVIVFL